MTGLGAWVRRALGRGDPVIIEKKSEPAPDPPPLEAFNVTRDRVIAAKVEWAGTSESRRRGLLGRESMDAGEGVYIVPTQWIHMFGMRFPIDVAFLHSSGRVLHIHHELRPNRLSRLVWRAEGALELSAGTLRATGTAVGDIIELRQLSE